MGAPKVVVVASGERATRAAERWLSDLRAQGLDVALLADRVTAPASSGVPGGALAHVGPLSVARALDVEMQLRTIDAVVATGARAKLALRLVPGTLRPAVGGLDVGLDAARAAELAGVRRR